MKMQDRPPPPGSPRPAAPRRAGLAVLVAAFAAVAMSAAAQDLPDTPPAPAIEEPAEGPRQPVSVVPVADDAEIATRLSRILEATGWFARTEVSVRDGVVFLDGVAGTQDQRRWAGALAENTEGTVAVVNRMEVEADVGSTFSRAAGEMGALARQAAQSWPLLLVGAVILFAAWLLGRLVGLAVRRLFAQRVPSPLLLSVIVRAFSIPVLLLGVYFVLQLAGLTRLAITVLGGTGLVGIIIGFAFRDIAENFLASLLLSVRNPFRGGDLIEVAGETGIVQNLNTRSTVLLTLDGNHVQIPNATVYKSTIRNYSSSPSRRADFMVGIGYDSPVSEAQALISAVLAGHPAVLDDPEPLVLVSGLGAATVDLKVHYWFDSATYAPDKINSALLRLTKSALLEGGIELPDPAREVVFPRGVPIVDMRPGGERPEAPPARPRPRVDTSAATTGEGGLSSQTREVTDQARGQVPEAEGENLLKR